MNDQIAFGRLITVLLPWSHQVVVIGGWAHRLYRLHQKAAAPPYLPLATLDADVAFAEGARLEGDIRERLLDAGFREQLSGNHRPPVSQYTLGDDGSGGFYAEFLTPMSGSGRTRQGHPLATVERGGITAQRLRYLDLLFADPWTVTLGEEWGQLDAVNLQIPNPVAFIVQKLLVHDLRQSNKKAQDILYIHDTLELFASNLGALRAIWAESVHGRLHDRWLRALENVRRDMFGELNDRIRDAAAIPVDRNLDPGRMRSLCIAALQEILD